MLFSKTLHTGGPNLLFCKPCTQVAGRLFGVTVERADGRAPVWHPDVQFFSLAKDGRPKAYFYLDPYSRPAGAIIHAAAVLWQRRVTLSTGPFCKVPRPSSTWTFSFSPWPRSAAPRPTSTWTPTAGLRVRSYTLLLFFGSAGHRPVL